MRYDVALLFGTFINWSVWGLYCCLFVATIWIVRLQSSTKMTSPPILAIIILFLMNFAFTGTSVTLVYDMFLGNSSLSDHARYTLITLTDALIVYVIAISNVATLWRLYIVWNRDWRVIAASLALLTGATISCTGFVILDILRAAHGDKPVYTEPSNNFAIAGFALSLPYNLIVTGLVIGRLWWAGRQGEMAEPPISRGITIMISIVESGSLYTVILLGYCIAYYVTDGNAQYFFTDSLPRVAAMVPTLVCLQRGLGYLQPAERDPASASPEVLTAMQIGRATRTQSSTVASHIAYTNAREEEEKRAGWPEAGESDTASKTSAVEADDKV